MKDLQDITSSESPKRFAIVDILRAYALLGVAVINYTGFHDWDYEHGTTFDLILGYLANYIFFRKSALLLSVLFGYGFAMLVENLKQKGVRVFSFFSRRMFWLFIISFINSCFYSGDILKSYAVLGMIVLLFYKFSTKKILVASVILLLLIPFSSGYTLFGFSDGGESLLNDNNLFFSHHFLDVVKYNLNHSYVGQATFTFYAVSVQHIMLCCFFWGMFIQRIHFMDNLQTNKVVIKRLFWFSIPAFALSTYLTYLGNGVVFLHLYYNFFIITFLCAMVFFASGIMWLYISGKFKKIFGLMELYGKMTLTNYIMQNIISFFIFTGVGFSVGNSKPYSFYFISAIIIFVLQLFFSKYWLGKFYYGPIEWIWRRLSLQRPIHFKKV